MKYVCAEFKHLFQVAFEHRMLILSSHTHRHKTRSATALTTKTNDLNAFQSPYGTNLMVSFWPFLSDDSVKDPIKSDEIMFHTNRHTVKTPSKTHTKPHIFCILLNINKRIQRHYCGRKISKIYSNCPNIYI